MIVAWLLVLGTAAGAFVLAGGSLSSGFSIPGTPTAQVNDRLAEELPQVGGATATVVFQNEDGTPFDDAQRAEISELLVEIADERGVQQIVDPFATAAESAAQEQAIAAGAAQIEQARAFGQDSPQLDEQARQLGLAARLLDYASDIRLVSDDGSTAIGVVVFTATQLDLPDSVKAAVAERLDDARIAGVQIDYSAELTSGVDGLIGPGEVIGVVIAAVVLMIVLGSVVAASLPLVSSLLGVGTGVAGSLAFAGVVDMSSVTPVLGVMLGLAVGIDYALFIINRHRRQVRVGMDVRESIALANGTSGSAVVFAGATVLIALLALNLTGIPFLGVMGTVGAVCVLIAVLIAVTLTPALLGLLGPRILSRRARAKAKAAVPDDAARPVRPMSTKRSVLTVALTVAGLLLVAVPALSMRLGLPDGSSEPVDSTQYRAYTVVAEEFGAGQNGPLLVVADLGDSLAADAVTETQADLALQLSRVPGVVAVAPVGVSADRDFLAFQVVPVDGPSAVSTETLVADLRDLAPVVDGATLGVAGQASGNIDISAKLAGALPIYLAVVVGLSVLILVVVFRSLLVPIIATGGFLLSLAAAFGAIVAVYQWGWFGDIFGVHDPGPVLNFAPIILVGVLFGLAMDYQLFLVSGMREAFVHGLPARAAVVAGVRSGRAVVIAAAIIMVSVFGGFVFSHLAMVRPLGFGLAVGVLFDAFVVRMLLVPALMTLVGKAAWWLPKWLDRIIPRVDIEGAALERRHPIPGRSADPQPVGSTSNRNTSASGVEATLPSGP